MKYEREMFVFSVALSTFFYRQMNYNFPYSNIQPEGRQTEHIIYADVLIFLNTVVTFMLLLAVKEVTKSEAGAGRLTSGAITGGIFSLFILADKMNVILLITIRLLMAAVIILITFRINGVKRFFRVLCTFFVSTFALAGITYGASVILPGDAVSYNNGYGYIDISAVSLIIITGVCYFCVCFIRRRFFTVTQSDHIYDVEVIYEDRSVSFRALYDSGNSLKDIYTGKPVIIIDEATAFRLTGETFAKAGEINDINEISERKLNIRLLPAGTVSGEKLLPAFTVSKAIIKGEGKQYISTAPCVAVSENDFGDSYCALINDDILI